VGDFGLFVLLVIQVRVRVSHLVCTPI
jgi:hypothetical protein